jgi:hypothetical protein
MWRRKTEHEKISEARILSARRKKLGLPALWALCIALGLSSIHALGFRGKYRSSHDPLSLSEAARFIPIASAFWFPLSFALLVYTRRKGQWESAATGAHICTQCQNIQAADPTGCNLCHHALEPLKDWRWSGGRKK